MPVSHAYLSSLNGIYRDITCILSKTCKNTGNPIRLIHPQFSLWHLSGIENLMLVLHAVAEINLWTKTFIKCLKGELAIAGSEINKWRFNSMFPCLFIFPCVNCIMNKRHSPHSQKGRVCLTKLLLWKDRDRKPDEQLSIKMKLSPYNSISDTATEILDFGGVSPKMTLRSCRKV